MPDTKNVLTSPQITAVAAILRRYQDQGSQALLPCLHEVQSVTGWLDEETCIEISKSLKVPLVQIHNVIEFYTLFYNEAVGQRIIRVCDDMPCYLAGSEAVLQAFAELLDLDIGGGTSSDGEWTLEVHPCLGRCEQAPFLMINDDDHCCVQPDQVPELLRGKA